MAQMIERNLLLYFRDKITVFFSLLSVIIVVGLYVLFLAKLQISSIQDSAGSFAAKNDIAWLVNCWILAGLLSIIPVTSTLGALGSMVDDKHLKIIKDFKSSPINMKSYPAAAIISSCIIGFIMSVASLILYCLYIYINLGKTFTVEQYIKTLILIMLTTIMSAAVMAFIVSFFSTISSYSAVSTVIGTIIGFITGVYVPMGVLPKSVQYVIEALPFGHPALLFRSVLMTDPINAVFKHIPVRNLNEYKDMYGVRYVVNGNVWDLKLSIIYIAAVAVIFTILFILNFNRKRKEL